MSGAEAAAIVLIVIAAPILLHNLTYDYLLSR